MTNRFTVIALCTVAATTLALGTSRPTAAADAPSVTVPYQDLNLSQAADAHVLYMRLVRAAGAVCPAVSSYELARFAASQRCVKTVLADAVQRVHSATLSAVADAGPSRIASLRGR